MSGRVEIAPVRAFLLELQDLLCAGLEAEETGAARFRGEHFEVPEAGLARPRVLEGGEVIEKSAVHFSHTFGKDLPAAATARRPELAGRRYEAVSVSLIVHPRNPYAPTSHMNVRFFLASPPGQAERVEYPPQAAEGGAQRGEAERSQILVAEGGAQRGEAERSSSGRAAAQQPTATAQQAAQQPIWWFGGGFDLTPYYGFEEDAIHWHRSARAACEPLGSDAWPRFKKSCDEYFYLPHRGEPRGIGGIFFDDLDAGGFERCFGFLRSVGEHYALAYLPILRRRKATPYGAREREFQLYRRGRYAEFNLVYDRGTKFGLQSGGRVESILASMPPLAAWRYDWRPEPGTPEARLYEVFLRPRDWLDAER